MTPVLSVVIPVYNAARTITRCIDSVIADLDSTPYSWELLLVDDGAEDDSLKIMQDYLSGSCHREQIRIIEQPNRGAAAARNAGIRGSSGQYVAFNDSDDIWLPGKTREQMQYLLSHPEVDMICGAHEVPFKPYFKKLSRYTRITVKDIALQNFCSPPTTIIKRSILSRTGLFDETMRMGAEEGSLFHAITYHGCCILRNDVVSKSAIQKRRWGESGLTGNIWRMERGKQYNFRQSYRKRYLSLGYLMICSFFSYLKYLRRLLAKQLFRLKSFLSK